MRGPDPDCQVCLGTGTDLVFGTACSECYSDSRLNAIRRQIASDYRRRRRHDAIVAAHRQRNSVLRASNYDLHLAVKAARKGCGCDPLCDACQHRLDTALAAKRIAYEAMRDHAYNPPHPGQERTQPCAESAA